MRALSRADHAALEREIPPARTFAFDLRPEGVKFSAAVYVLFHTIHALLRAFYGFSKGGIPPPPTPKKWGGGGGETLDSPPNHPYH